MMLSWQQMNHTMGSPSTAANPTATANANATGGGAAVQPNHVVALNLNSHSFASTLTSPGPSPDKTVRTNASSKHQTNATIALLPTPRGSSKMHDHGPAGSARRKKKAQEANQKFEEAINAGECLVHREISRGGKVSSVAWSPVQSSRQSSNQSSSQSQSQSSVVAIGTDDGFVSIVDAAVDDDDQRFVLREFPREGKVRSLSWSSDGRLLAIGGDDCIAAVVDTKTMQIITELEREDRVYSVQFSPDDELLAIGGFDGMVAVALVTKGHRHTERNDNDNDCTYNFELLTEIPRQGLVLSLSWSPDSSLLAACGSDKQLTVFDVDGWDVVSELERPSSIHCVRWSPDGRHIVLGGQDGSVVVVDVEARSIVREIQREEKLANAQQQQKQHSGSAAPCRINAVCWNGDGSFLCIGSSDRVASIYETKSYVLLHEIRRGGDVVCVDWQGGSGYLAIGGDDRKVGIVKTGGIHMSPFGHSHNHNRANSSDDPNVNVNVNAGMPVTSTSNRTSAPGVIISAVPQSSDESSFAADWADDSKEEFAPVGIMANDGNNNNNNKSHVLIPQVTASSEAVEKQSSQQTTSINVVAMSNDVYYMASGGSDGSVLVYGTDNWEVVMVSSLFWIFLSVFISAVS